MKQGNKTFSTFISGFQKKMLEAGKINWNDQITKTFFNNALNTEMHKALIGFPIPPTYTGYCNMFHGMNNQSELLRFKDKRDGPTVASSFRHSWWWWSLPR